MKLFENESLLQNSYERMLHTEKNDNDDDSDDDDGGGMMA